MWGRLWCLPEFATATAAAAFIRNSLGLRCRAPCVLAPLEHAFTHFDLTITPLLVHCTDTGASVEEGGGLWYNLREPARIGLPAPISALLARLAGRLGIDAVRLRRWIELGDHSVDSGRNLE